MGPASNFVLTQSYSGCLLRINVDYQYILINVDEH